MIDILMCIDGFIIVAFTALVLFKKIAPRGVGMLRVVLGLLIGFSVAILVGGLYFTGGVWLSAKGFELYNIPCFAYYCIPLFLIQPLIKQYKTI